MTIQKAIDFAIEKLEKVGIDDAKIDAFLLLEAGIGIDKAKYYLDKEKEISKEEEKRFFDMIDRRVNHEPCQYIIGKTNFMGFDINVNKNVLIPRQDTESVVEETLKRIPSNAKVLDMCTGSGCIAIALKKLKENIDVYAVDISTDALEVAKKNIDENNCDIKLIQSDLFENIEDDLFFDVIVSNPPYVTDEEYEKLLPEVKNFEPKLALVAGKEGLDIYKRLILEAKKHLKDDGMVSLEIGCNQAKDVSDILEENGYHNIEVLKDLPGLDRNVIAYK